MRDVNLPTKVCLVKATVFPVAMYGCESWTVKKAECRRIDDIDSSPTPTALYQAFLLQPGALGSRMFSQAAQAFISKSVQSWVRTQGSS